MSAYYYYLGKHTLPTAASPSRTSLTLLLGLGAEGVEEESVMEVEVEVVSRWDGEGGRFARRLRPRLRLDSLGSAIALTPS